MPNLGRRPRPASERFYKQARISTTGCIEWTGYRDRDGYGQFRPAGGRASTKVRAHRWSYEHFVGPVPDGLVLDHLCRNRGCVNPEHLEPVTNRENIFRGETPARLNAQKERCVNGHAFDVGNVGRTRSGHRYCITCKKAQSASNYQQRRAAS